MHQDAEEDLDDLFNPFPNDYSLDEERNHSPLFQRLLNESPNFSDENPQRDQNNAQEDQHNQDLPADPVQDDIHGLQLWINEDALFQEPASDTHDPGDNFLHPLQVPREQQQQNQENDGTAVQDEEIGNAGILNGSILGQNAGNVSQLPEQQRNEQTVQPLLPLPNQGLPDTYLDRRNLEEGRNEQEHNWDLGNSHGGDYIQENPQGFNGSDIAQSLTLPNLSVVQSAPPPQNEQDEAPIKEISNERQELPELTNERNNQQVIGDTPQSLSQVPNPLLGSSFYSDDSGDLLPSYPDAFSTRQNHPTVAQDGIENQNGTATDVDTHQAEVPNCDPIAAQYSIVIDAIIVMLNGNRSQEQLNIIKNGLTAVHRGGGPSNLDNDNQRRINSIRSALTVIANAGGPSNGGNENQYNQDLLRILQLVEVQVGEQQTTSGVLTTDREQEVQIDHQAPTTIEPYFSQPPTNFQTQEGESIVEPVERQTGVSPEYNPTTDQPSEQRTEQKRLGNVVHSSVNIELLNWMAESLTESDQDEPWRHTLEETSGAESRPLQEGNISLEGGQNIIQTPAGQLVPIVDSGSSRRRSQIVPNSTPASDGRRAQVDCFSTALANIRMAGNGLEEVLKSIEVQRLPSLDDEVRSDFRETNEDIINWSCQRTNSPTLNRIMRDVRQDNELTSISAEMLFNHLFCLSRKSFLQRDDRVHLELMTAFFSSGRSENLEGFDEELREVILWLEGRFTSANLPKIVQELVNGVDENNAMRYVAEEAKDNYKPTLVEMTVLGAFYKSMTKHSEIMEANKDTTKRKKELEKRIEEMEATIAGLGRRRPRNKYGKHRTRRNAATFARESAMKDTFAATRWLVVGDVDSHYAYACSVLEAAGDLHMLLQQLHQEKLRVLSEELLNNGQEEDRRGDEVRYDPVERRAAIVAMCTTEKARPMHLAESVLLHGYGETMKELSKIKVVDMLRRIGGNIPAGFARVLDEKENEIETFRGVSYMDGIVVAGIVKVAEMVEKAEEKHNSAEGLFGRREQYLERCRDIINSAVEERYDG